MKHPNISVLKLINKNTKKKSLTLDMAFSLPGSILPGYRFEGMRITLRWTRDDIVGPVDMVIRITANK